MDVELLIRLGYFTTNRHELQKKHKKSGAFKPRLIGDYVLVFVVFIVAVIANIVNEIGGVVTSVDWSSRGQAGFAADIIDELFGTLDGESTSDLEAKRNVFVKVLVANVLDWDWGIGVVLWIEGEVELEAFSDHVDTEVGLGVETEGVATIGNAALKAIA